MPTDDRRDSAKHKRANKNGQVSELHDGDAFGELQGELRQNALDHGFQQQLLVDEERGKEHLQQQAQPEAKDEDQKRNQRREKNRP